MRRQLDPVQPLKLRAQQQVERLVSDGRLAVGSSAGMLDSEGLLPELVGAQGPEWAALVAEAKSSGGFVV